MNDRHHNKSHTSTWLIICLYWQCSYMSQYAAFSIKGNKRYSSYTVERRLSRESKISDIMFGYTFVHYNFKPSLPYQYAELGGFSPNIPVPAGFKTVMYPEWDVKHDFNIALHKILNRQLEQKKIKVSLLGYAHRHTAARQGHQAKNLYETQQSPSAAKLNEV